MDEKLLKYGLELAYFHIEDSDELGELAKMFIERARELEPDRVYEIVQSWD